MQTRKYYTRPYLTEYTTKLVSKTEINGQYHVVLKNTIFYPEGGGQPADNGFLNDIPVLDVYEKDNQVFHILPQPITTAVVNCKINWERRFYHMQHHSGQHVMSAIFYRHYNYQTHGFHLGADYSTIDIATESNSTDFLTEAEEKINQLVQSNLPIKTYFVSETDQLDLNLRKEPQVETDDIRLVAIEGVDAVPCCGTHLKRTGEIGLIKIIKTEKQKKLTRIYYRCGQAALKDYQLKHNTITKLAQLFSSADHHVFERVTAELDHKKQLENQIYKVQQQLFSYTAQELVNQADQGLILAPLEGEANLDLAQILIKEIHAITKALVLVIMENRIFLAQNLDSQLDCNDLIAKYGRPIGGRGGGRADFAQVYFPTQLKIEEFIAEIKSQFN